MGDFELKRFSRPSELAEAAAGDWLTELEGNRCRTVALSGGRIAGGFFDAVVRQADPSAAYWKEVHFFWGDERCVAPEDAESNFRLARERLFLPLGIPACQMHRIKGELPEALATQEAASELLRLAPLGPKGEPVLDLVFLGMGEEGHVASLFPGESQELMSSGAVFRAVQVPKPPPSRVTLGYSTLAAARQVWVLASGSAKTAALHESLHSKGGTPLAWLLRLRNQTRIYTDIS
jgi:6-phosphogluconolactonase